MVADTGERSQYCNDAVTKWREDIAFMLNVG